MEQLDLRDLLQFAFIFLSPSAVLLPPLSSSSHPMDDRTETHVRRRSVPEFGGWDHNAPGASNYSVVFTQARADRKQQKTDLTRFKRMSLDQQKHHHHHRHHAYRDHHRRDHQYRHHHHHQPFTDDSVVSKRKKLLTYLNCCIRP